ncbi:MAG: DEAD/DEAH box helicase [Candidatus Nanopelagicales bacterium]
MARRHAWLVEWDERIDLGGGKIPVAEAERQSVTAQEILLRLREQPGVVLADEVGLGKTFVALAVAAATALSDSGKHPVIVMVPPALTTKWPQEWDTFRAKCLPDDVALQATPETVKTPAAFLKLFDDSRYQIAFVAHGALTRQVRDPFTRLAIIRAAFYRTSTLKRVRAAFPRMAASLLSDHRFDETTTDLLLDSPLAKWRDIWNSRKSEAHHQEDDPVYLNLHDMIRTSGVSLQPLRNTLRALPVNRNTSFARRVAAAKGGLQSEVQTVWDGAISHAPIRSPLLILDEAHHVRNDGKVAGLFASPEAAEDAEALGARGALAGKFDRMLFLTATPFQLGHSELIRVLSRFGGASWASTQERATFTQQLSHLDTTLGSLQHSALRLEKSWGRLEASDVLGLPDRWWDADDISVLPNGRLQQTAVAVRDLARLTVEAQAQLRPWVIRHVRKDRTHRRAYHPGDAIRPGGDPLTGLEVGANAILPFLVAARARTIITDRRLNDANARAYFAEGLASSFEAYRDTRRNRESFLDTDEPIEEDTTDSDLQWYLDWIEKSLPRDKEPGRPTHPKVAATVARAVETWGRGEKTLIFAYYIETGRTLQREISAAIEARIFASAAERLNMASASPADIQAELRRIGENATRAGREGRHELDERLLDMALAGGLSQDDAETFARVVRGFLRTESFLVRYLLPIGQDARSLVRALDESNEFGEPIAARLERFLGRLSVLPPLRRKQTLDDLDTYEKGRIRTLDRSEDRAKSMILPNVRLANGRGDPNTRRVLVSAFNMPFFPDVLISSTVLSEGIDLHWECRTVIHHDLDWNPSTLEQRNGRLDRIGSHAEAAGRPIDIYEPYTTGLHDEKTYRVVTDRGRWFNLVMGDEVDLSEAATDRLSERVELPRDLAESLTLDLAVYRT